MLEAIRKRSAGILVKLLFVLLIISFGAWGIGDYVGGGGGSNTVATIGEVEISTQEFNTEFQREFNRLRQAFGGEVTREQARAFGIDRRVLGQIVNRILVQLGAQDLGVSISDDLIREEIQKTSAFHSTIGNFERALFEQVLQSNGLTEAGYINLLRTEMSNAQYLGSIESGVKAPRSLVNRVYRYRQEKRTADTVLVPDSSITGISEPTGSELTAFHKENAQRFTAPEYRSLTVVELQADELAKEISVADELIKEAFENRQDEFNTPEQRTLQQMVVGTELDANIAHAMLVKGDDFATVAMTVAKMDAKSLELGKMTRDKLLPELAEAAFGMPQGGFSKPVKSPLGWHIFRVAGIERARQKTFAEVKGDLTKELAREKAIDGLFSLSNKLEDALGGGSTLEEASQSINLKTRKIANIDARGLGTDGKQISGLPKGKFLETASQTEESTESQLTESGTDGYFILRVDKITAPALKPLASIRGDVVNAWKAQQRIKKGEEKAKAALARLKGGADFATVATELGTKVSTSPAFTRFPDGSLPAEMVTNAFTLKKGEYTLARGDTGYTIARLKDIQDANPSSDKKGVDEINRLLEQGLKVDINSQISSDLRKRFPVTVNQATLDRLFQ